MARLWTGTYLTAQTAMVRWKAHCSQEELNGPTDQFPFQWAGATLGLAFALHLKTFRSSEKNREKETTLFSHTQILGCEMGVGGSWRAERKLIDLSPSSTPLFYCKNQYPLASAAALPFPWVQPGFMLLIIISSLILSNSVCFSMLLLCRWDCNCSLLVVYLEVVEKSKKYMLARMGRRVGLGFFNLAVVGC